MFQTPITHKDKLIAALTYVFWPVALLVLLSTNRERPFRRYHAWHALSFSVLFFLLLVGFICVDIILGRISEFLGALFSCVLVPAWALPYLTLLWLAVRAYQGEMFQLPFVTDFLKKQGWL